MSRAQIVGIVALGALAAACDGHLERDVHAGPAASAAAAPKVTVAQPLVAPVGEWSDHTGRAEAVDSVEIRPRASGHLQRVAFKEGELVKAGDLLFVVDPRPYGAALSRAQADLERAQVDQQQAQREATRAETLFKTHVITEQERDTQSSSLLQLMARAKVAGAAVSSAQLDLEYAYVRAPIAGRIGRTLVTAGNLVGPAMPSPLTTLVSVNPLHVYVDVDESNALRLGRGARGAPPVVAQVGFSDEPGHPHAATVDFVDNRVDPQTGTLRVRVVVKNDDGRLTPGLFARVRMPLGAAHDTVLVDDRAVGTDQDRRYVYVVDPQNKVQYRAVKLGPLHEGLRVVREGLTPADRVVVVGLQRVRPGAPVSVDLVPMAAPAAQAVSPAPSSSGKAVAQ